MEDKLSQEIDKYLVGDISPDAGLAEIKAKQSEIIEKQRKSVKTYLKRRRELLEIERIEMVLNRKYFLQVAESSRSAAKGEKLNREEKEKRTQNLVSNDPKGIDIYKKLETARHLVADLETIMKNNKMIADRVENMLNAQINLDKIGGRNQ